MVKFNKALIALAIGLGFGGLASPSIAQQRILTDDIFKHCPDMSEEDAKAITELSKQNFMSASYAHGQCLTAQEGLRRMNLQGQWSTGPTAKIIQSVITKIKENESATFAGHWIQHQPDYRMAVAFTKNAETTLAKYTDNPIFVAIERPGANQDTIDKQASRVFEALNKAGIGVASGHGNIQKGTYEIQLIEDRVSELRDMARRGEIFLPDWVKLIPPPPFPHDAPQTVTAPNRVKAFPQYKKRRDLGFSTVAGVSNIRGELRLVDGCLKIKTKAYERNILWQKLHALDLSNTERVGVMSRRSGQAVFAGDDVVIHGLQPGPNNFVENANKKPDLWAKVANDTDGSCPAPYIMVEDIQTSDVYESEFVETWVERLKRQGLGAEEARKKVRELRKVELGIIELRDELFAKRKDAVAGGIAYMDYFAHATNPNRPNIRPPFTLLIKKGFHKNELVPKELRPYTHVEYTPYSIADFEKDRAILETFIGKNAEVEFNIFEEEILITDVADLTKLSEFLTSNDTTVTIPVKVRLNNSGSTGLNPVYEKRDDLRQHTSYKPLLALAKELYKKAHGHVPSDVQIENQILTAIHKGFTDFDEVKRLEENAYGPLSAYLYLPSPHRRLKDAVLSDAMVIAQPINFDLEDKRDDGYRSTVTFTVKETLKGSLKANQTVKVRLRSGADDEGNQIQGQNEPFLLPGFEGSLREKGPWLIFLSSSETEDMWTISRLPVAEADGRYSWPLYNDRNTAKELRSAILPIIPEGG